MPGNYRPISILPILYKLFSRVLDARLKVLLSKTQSVDQAGFKKGFGCGGSGANLWLFAKHVGMLVQFWAMLGQFGLVGVVLELC